MSESHLSPGLKFGLFLLGLISVPLLVIAFVLIFGSIIGIVPLFESAHSEMAISKFISLLLMYFLVPACSIVFYIGGRSLNYLSGYLAVVHSNSLHPYWFRNQVTHFMKELRFLVLFMGIASSSVLIIHGLVKNFWIMSYLVPCAWGLIIILATLIEHIALKALSPKTEVLGR